MSKILRYFQIWRQKGQKFEAILSYRAEYETSLAT